jgi:hypothetical protein
MEPQKNNDEPPRFEEGAGRVFPYVFSPQCEEDSKASA